MNRRRAEVIADVILGLWTWSVAGHAYAVLMGLLVGVNLGVSWVSVVGSFLLVLVWRTRLRTPHTLAPRNPASNSRSSQILLDEYHKLATSRCQALGDMVKTSADAEIAKGAIDAAFLYGSVGGGGIEVVLIRPPDVSHLGGFYECSFSDLKGVLEAEGWTYVPGVVSAIRDRRDPSLAADTKTFEMQAPRHTGLMTVVLSSKGCEVLVVDWTPRPRNREGAES